MQKPGVLVIHNRYQQPGGEDTVVEADIALLRRAGHRVLCYERHNSEIDSYSTPRKGSLLFTATWNAQSYKAIRSLIRKHKPDIAHCHNMLPLVSPAAYYACKAEGVPVVQTLHNYRLICPAGTLFHNGRRCSDCGRLATRGLWRGCYRNSRWQTGAVAAMVGCHRIAQTWTQAVDAYLSPSQFCREMHVRAGLPAERTTYRPNFLSADPGVRTARGDHALFVGRLSPEKGALEMLAAWRKLGDIPLRVIGGGPLWHEAARLISSASLNANLLGQQSRAETLEQMKSARFLLFPSRWHEPFGMTLLEAAASGVPAVAARVGAVPELVTHQRTGQLFDPDDAEEFAESVRWAWEHPQRMEEMGREARTTYLRRFTAEQGYEHLMHVYRNVLRN